MCVLYGLDYNVIFAKASISLYLKLTQGKQFIRISDKYNYHILGFLNSKYTKFNANYSFLNFSIWNTIKICTL